jgi:hypothetical protein
MADIEVQEELPVLQTRGVCRHGFWEGHTDETPFASIILTNTIGDEEQLVGALDDGSS